MASVHHYYAWDVSSNNVLSNPTTRFHTNMFDFHVNYHLVQESCYTDPITLNTTHSSYLVPRSLISSANGARDRVIDFVLSCSGIARDFIDYSLPEISSAALEINDCPCPDCRNARIVIMNLDIYFITHFDDPEVMNRVLRESMDDSLRFQPASKSCMEGLKRVRVEDEREASSTEDCMICLEKPSVGAEVIRLPCKHAFHGDCIVRWLETSHFCPLCRFSMEN